MFCQHIPRMSKYQSPLEAPIPFNWFLNQFTVWMGFQGSSNLAEQKIAEIVGIYHLPTI